MNCADGWLRLWGIKFRSLTSDLYVGYGISLRIGLLAKRLEGLTRQS
jgi:hypothetical protein